MIMPTVRSCQPRGDFKVAGKAVASGRKSIKCLKCSLRFHYSSSFREHAAFRWSLFLLGIL
jgi:hypothetical protein